MVVRVLGDNLVAAAEARAARDPSVPHCLTQRLRQLVEMRLQPGHESRRPGVFFVHLLLLFRIERSACTGSDGGVVINKELQPLARGRGWNLREAELDEALQASGRHRERSHRSDPRRNSFGFFVFQVCLKDGRYRPSLNRFPQVWPSLFPKLVLIWGVGS